MRKNFAVAALAASLALQACSSRPREFNPMLAPSATDRAGFEAAHSECRELLAQGKLNSSGQLASAGAGAAAGATTLAVGGAAASTAGGIGGFAVASATVIALPFVAVGGAWGMAKAKKNKKERQVQIATAGCLAERGYGVVGWEPAKKKAAATLRQPR